MSLYEQLQSDLKTAQLNRNGVVLGALRMLMAAIKNKEIEKRSKSSTTELTDDEIISVIFSEVKKRRDAAEQYRGGNRLELAEKEENELKILSKYLPAQLSEDEIRKIVKDGIAETQAIGLQDLGKVMAIIMPKVKGRAEGGTVTRIVKDELK